MVLTGCTSLRDSIDKFLGIEEGGTADELAWEGMDAYESGKYLKAITKFQKIKDFYPFSKYAILAELKIADAVRPGSEKNAVEHVFFHICVHHA